jgi:hypothetical protein
MPLPPVVLTLEDSPTVRRSKALTISVDISRVVDATQVRTPLDEDVLVRVWLSDALNGDPLSELAVATLTRGELDQRRDYRRNWWVTMDVEAVAAALTGVANGDPVFVVIEIAGELDSVQKEAAA